MGAVVDGRYDAAGLELTLDVDVFVELDDGRRIEARDTRWLGRVSIYFAPAGSDPVEPAGPSEEEAVAMARQHLEDERIHERWDGLLWPVLRAGARPRVWRLARRPLAIELSPELRRSLAGR